MLKHNVAAADSLEDASVPARRITKSAQQQPALARIGKYEVESEIGNGARIRAFTGLDRPTGRAVSLKLAMDVTDAAFLDRFRRAVALAANVGSSEFAAIYELGEHVGFTFVAMQRAGEDDMRRVLKRIRFLSLLQKISIMCEIASGAQAAHAAGLGYIGIRPSGITLGDREHAVIQDFGVVRLYPEDPEESAAYAAPEELAGAAPDVLCDVFSFGILFYQLVTGTHPFESAEDGQAPASLLRAAPDCPEALDALVRRAIEKERALRYQTFDEIQEDAEPILRQLKCGRSAALLEDARAFVNAEEFDRAQVTVRQALELDPNNSQADRLRAEIRGLLKRRTAGPRIEALLNAAEEAAGAKDHDRALEILNSVRELDVSDPQLLARLESVGRRVAQIREATRLISDARRLMEEERFAEARTAASDALAADPESSEASRLLGEIDAVLRGRERETKVEQGLLQAKALLLIESFDAALAGLEALRTEFPEFAIVEQWIERVKAQKDAAERKDQIESQLRDVRSLLENGRFDDAMGSLELVAAHFPDADVSDLLIQARDAKEREARTTQALEEAGWLLGQDRPDLALQFMREKAPELKTDARFAARLAEIEAAHAEWQKRRSVEECLRQVIALEQLKQWPVALTVLEEALAANPASGKLLAAAERLRGRLMQQDRRSRFARRLELINKRIAAQDWTQALAMIEAARSEFPEEGELPPLEHHVRAALRRARCQSIASEVRQRLADGDAEQASQILRKGLDEFPNAPVLAAVLRDVEADKRYRDEWRMAQVLFGRRQFEKAEALLVGLATAERPEVQTLLELVRERRTATEEAEFYKRGVDKALKLIEETEFDQAADLLRNLLSLFPGDVILERHLQSALRGGEQDRGAPEAAPALVEAAPPEPEPAPAALPQPEEPRPTHAESVAPLSAPTFEPAKKRVPWPVLVVGALSLPLAGFIWQYSRSGDVSAPRPPSQKAEAPQPAQESALPGPAPAQTPTSSPKKWTPAENSSKTQTALRKFNPPAAGSQAQPLQQAALPAPPGVAAGAGSGAFPAELLGRSRPALPARPQPAAPAPTPAPTVPASDLRPATPISRRPPETPTFARQHGIFGPVELEASIDKRGVVTNAKVLTGNPVLGDAAKRAVLNWRYRPATLNGQPIESKLAVRVIFAEGR